MTASPAGKLITVAGIDGAGKSTLAAALHGALKDGGHDAVLIGKHTTEVPADAALSAYLDSLNASVYRRDQAIGAACGDHYWLFALAAWYSLQDRLVIQPALQAGTHVILDNAHHKIIARYAASPDVPAGLAPQVFAHLTPADLILFLRISPQEALRRKGVFTPLEAGRTGATREAFVSYQDDVTARLREQAGQEGWAPIDVTGLPPGSVLDQALAMLTARLGIISPRPSAASRSSTT
jgi:thymidylate kinase